MMSGVMALPGRSWLIIVVSSCVRFVEIEVRPPRPLVVPRYSRRGDRGVDEAAR